MAMVAWPSSVPFSPSVSFVLKGASDGFTKVEFDKGAPSRRRNTTAGLGSADWVIPKLTLPETAALLQWHYSVLAAGTLPFEAENPLTGLISVWAFASGIDVEWLTKEYRRVSFTLDLYPGLV